MGITSLESHEIDLLEKERLDKEIQATYDELFEYLVTDLEEVLNNYSLIDNDDIKTAFEKAVANSRRIQCLCELAD